MKRTFILGLTVTILLSFGNYRSTPVQAQSNDPLPPAQPVKLIFIHHSTGKNWLADYYGDLGRELTANNYFVSDTYYGWGPNSIGDRTDIVNWSEWFRSSETPRYMEALFNASGQQSDYVRTFDDPGGENQIVMFKSCFPNSALAGTPNDPPDSSEDFTIGHAKYVYNDLLNYFSTRPDKLFIVITAPPLQDSTFADNARAFNNWLVNDWLAENNYALKNVAVFDFYNVLTHPDNHHRVNDGQIEHSNNGVNTLYYDSNGDDHPNIAGSQKATQEFLPLLNLYYHRWLEETQEVQPFPVEDPTPTTEAQTPPENEGQPEDESLPPDSPPIGLPSSDLIDDFEGTIPPGTEGWQSYWDKSTPTQFSCALENSSLHIVFDIPTDSWATCTLFFDSLLDWSTYQGVAFSYQADAPARIFDFTLHSGTTDEPTSYQYSVESIPGSDEAWIPMELTWSQILGVDWEADARNPIDPDRISGVSVGFSTYEGAPNNGTIWIDDLRLLEEEAETPVEEVQMDESNSQPETELEEAPTEAESPTGKTQTNESESEAPAQEGNGLCPGSMAMVGLTFVGVILKRRYLIS